MIKIHLFSKPKEQRLSAVGQRPKDQEPNTLPKQAHLYKTKTPATLDNYCESYTGRYIQARCEWGQNHTSLHNFSELAFLPGQSDIEGGCPLSSPSYFDISTLTLNSPNELPLHTSTGHTRVPASRCS